MKSEVLLSKIERAWAFFIESYAGLTSEQMLEPGVTDDWSIKDILAHVTWWEEETLKHLPTIMKGNQPPRYSDLFGGIDAFNAQMTRKKHNLPLSEVLNQLEDTHLSLIKYIQSVPEDQYACETRFRHRLRMDTYSLYPIHAKAIRAWRERTK